MFNLAIRGPGANHMRTPPEMKETEMFPPAHHEQLVIGGMRSAISAPHRVGNHYSEIHRPRKPELNTCEWALRISAAEQGEEMAK